MIYLCKILNNNTLLLLTKMGRFYTGDIEGKFWFGIQSSSDISELVSYDEHKPTYIWKSCSCDVDDDLPEDDKYCKACFSSKNEHIDTVEEEGDYVDGLLYIEEQCIHYSLDKETHYQELVDNMSKMKEIIDEGIMEEYESIKQTDDILNAFSGVFNHIFDYMNNNIVFEDNIEKHKVCSLVARYTLGYQIEYCLRTTESCNIQCET